MPLESFDATPVLLLPLALLMGYEAVGTPAGRLSSLMDLLTCVCCKEHLLESSPENQLYTKRTGKGQLISKRLKMSDCTSPPKTSSYHIWWIHPHTASQWCKWHCRRSFLLVLLCVLVAACFGKSYCVN